jgi:hypothetical protein
VAGSFAAAKAQRADLEIRPQPVRRQTHGVAKEEQEFLTAEPHCRIAGPDEAAECSADPAQYEIAGAVTAAVVDPFEPVEIEQQERQRLTTAHALRQLAFADLAKPAAVQ